MSLQTVPTTPTPTSSSQLQQQQQQQLQHQHQHEIAIFWDLLNVPLPTGMSASSTAKAIVDAVSSYGRIIDRRLYCDFTTATATTTTTTITTTADASASSTSASSPSSASNTNTAHSSSSSNNNNHQQQQQHSLFLQDAGGFDLVPTTRRRHQDKRLMADIWTFCWDSSARKGNPCVVLLTNDGDYAYMLTKLRDRGVMTIVMIGQNDIGAWAILRDAADVALSLEQDVLPATATATATSTLRTTDTIACNGSMLSSPPAITTTFSDTTTTTDRNSISADLLVLDLCRLVRNAQLAQEASPDNPYTDEWVDFGSVASYLQQIVSKNNLSGGENVKEFTKDIRKKAESKGYVQVGRRIINNNKDRSSPHAAAVANNKRKIVASFKNPKFSYSTEVYIRLLPAGMIALTEHQQQHEHDHKRSSSSSSPTKAAAGSPNNNSKKSCCVYFRQLPINIRVVDLVQFVEETYDVTVLRALLESPGQNARSCHVEFTDPNHATLMLQKAKKAGGGEGMIFRGRYIGVVPNSRASALNKKGNEVVYYERMVSTAVVSSKSSDNTFRQNDTNHNKDNTTTNNNDTVNDTALLCQSILDLDSSQQEQYHTGSSVAWIGGGAVGQLFRVKLPDHVLEISTKDEVSTRFRTARDTAITNGLVEMGRRKMDSAVTATSSAISGTTASSSSSAGEYVVVPLTKPYSTNAATDATARLSKETYLRLLPEGRALALSRKQEAPLQVGANSHDESTPEKSSAGNVNATVRQCVFLNNVADSTGATQLAEFFETTVEGIQVDRIELEPSNWKGSICFAAHIQFSSPQQAKAVLAYSKATGLIHRGRRLYAAPDRTTPDIVAENKIERPTEMSYTRDLAKVKKLEPIAKPNSFFLSAQDNVIFGNISFDGSNSIDSNDHAADLVSGLLGPSKTEEPKDPFEDLLWS